MKIKNEKIKLWKKQYIKIQRSEKNFSVFENKEKGTVAVPFYITKEAALYNSVALRRYVVGTYLKKIKNKWTIFIIVQKNNLAALKKHVRAAMEAKSAAVDTAADKDKGEANEK